MLHVTVRCFGSQVILKDIPKTCFVYFVKKFLVFFTNCIKTIAIKTHTGIRKNRRLL
jgi:hypothetical protein